MIFDDVIVGAGSSGAVLAARLSEDRSRQVLLIESGPDYRSAEVTPDDLLFGQVSLVDHDWGYTAEALAGHTISYPRGKVVGGSSAVNGTIALRGDPADFDEWAARGLTEWTWDDVVPFYRLVEDDPEGVVLDAREHRTGGHLPIDRVAPSAWQPFHAAFREACLAHGFVECADMNSPGASGVGVFPRNKRNGVRMSTALTYLASARDRSNLTILSDAHVDFIDIEDGRAVAVEVIRHNQRRRVEGRRITLAAGAIASPAILMRSGIGPRARLEELQIACRADLPVGMVLLDHPSVGLPGLPVGGIAHDLTIVTEIGVRYRSGRSPEDNDMQLCLATMFDPEQMRGFMPDPVAMFMVGAVLMRPHSTGRLSIESTDPFVAPRIELNYLDNPRDTARLIEAWRIGRDLCRTEPLASMVQCLLVDDATLDDDRALESLIREQITTTFHPAGTAPMGLPDDDRAVVDAHGRVHGIDGLRVVDASIMPTSVRSNTNLTVIMMAERLASWMANGD
ncbi:MAG: GMC family oxidoreductase N-terminal domain-containing protein [Acidimicrobiales bacterium]